MTLMSRTSPFTGVLFAAALGTLTACGPINRGLDSVHQPVVQQSDYSLDLRAPLGQADRDWLERWFAALDLRYGDQILLDDRADGSESSRSTIARMVAQQGLKLDAAPAEGVPPPQGTVRVIVRRAVASVPGCPDWRRASNPEPANSTMSNYGCATNANLAAMVADPNDLVKGKEGEGPDAQITNRSIGGWRNAPAIPPRSLKEESTGGVKSGGSQ